MSLGPRVHIDLGSRSYDIAIGSDLLSSIKEHLPFDVKGKKIFMITDTNVQPYADDLQEELLALGAVWCKILVFPYGEAMKSYDRLKEVHDWMLRNNVHRNSIVFAVGGGVVGDLTGYAASTIMRGVPFVQVPTSLLAQVDSSVGGKTGINTVFGKNLVGSFYQPVSVVIDTETLKTLPKRELYSGYAEVVKYGLIGDKEFFEWLENGNGARVLSLEPEAIAKAIEVSCRAKAEIVEADEHEVGKRALLNLGHTFGHALEAVAGYRGMLLHGEAVSLGMVMAYDLSVRMGLSSPEDLERVRNHLREVGLPVSLSDITSLEGLMTNTDALKVIMHRDKKAVDDNMVFIVPRGIGDAFLSNEVPEQLVNDVLNEFLHGEKGQN